MAKGRADKAKGAASSKSKAAPATAPTTNPTPPSWPVFKPPLPLTGLTIESLVPGKVVLIRNFWPRSLCRDYVSFLRSLPLITTPSRPKKGEAARVNDRYQIEDPRFALRLWLETGLKNALLDNEFSHLWDGDVVGLSSRIRVYRYGQGQFFDSHYDDYNHVTVQSETGEHIPSKTTWTLLLYLTSAADGCIGGETVFHPRGREIAKDEIAVPPETGMLLLHKHGDDCMLHEGREVTGGEKWVIRSDLCVRK